MCSSGTATFGTFGVVSWTTRPRAFFPPSPPRPSSFLLHTPVATRSSSTVMRYDDGACPHRNGETWGGSGDALSCSASIVSVGGLIERARPVLDGRDGVDVWLFGCVDGVRMTALCQWRYASVAVCSVDMYLFGGVVVRQRASDWARGCVCCACPSPGSVSLCRRRRWALAVARAGGNTCRWRW